MTTTVWLDGKSLTVSKMLAASPERKDNLSDDIRFKFALFLADTIDACESSIPATFSNREERVIAKSPAPQYVSTR